MLKTTADEISNRAAFAVRLADGFFVARRSLRGSLSSGGLATFSTREAAEDYILDMIGMRFSAFRTAKVFKLG